MKKPLKCKIGLHHKTDPERFEDLVFCSQCGDIWENAYDFWNAYQIKIKINTKE